MCEEYVDVQTEAAEPDKAAQENRKEECDEENVDESGREKDLVNDLVGVVREMKDVLADTGRKDELIANLHERVASFEEKRDWREIKKPLYLDLIAMVDAFEDQQRIAARYVAWSRMLPERSNSRRFIRWTNRNIRCMKGIVLDLLSRRGIARMPNPLGEEFDRTCQRAVKRVLADSAEEDRQVCKVIRNGYVSDDEGIVRYQEVWVKRYTGECAGKEEKKCQEQ